MKKKIFIELNEAIGLVLIIYFMFLSPGKKTTTITFGKVTKGNFDLVITSLGTLEATSTVDVETQLSRKITELSKSI